MFTITRLRPVLHVGLIVAATTMLLYVAFFAAGALWPQSPEEEPTLHLNRRHRQAKKFVDAALADYREGRVDPDRCVCVLFGISGAQYGLSLQTLADSDRGDCLYLGLCFPGRNMAQIGAASEVVLQSELRPQYVVFAISPFQLIRGNLAKPPEGLTQAQLDSLAKQEDEPERLWLHERRGELRFAADEALASLRKRILQPRETRVEQPIDPWLGNMAPRDLGTEFDAKHSERQLAFYTALDYFEPSAYHQRMGGLATLTSHIRQFRAGGTSVIVALNPEHSALRERVPSNAVLIIKEVLEREFGPNVVPTLDFREALDDSGFYDIIHPNSLGRESYSRVFAARVSDLLYDVPSSRPDIELLD